MQQIQDREQLMALAQELGVRPDWHEPDEQGVTAVVAGDSFDNAMPAGEFYGPPGERHAEMHVTLYRTEWDEERGKDVPNERLAVVNLASLFAWATEERVDETRTIRGERAERYWRDKLAAELRAYAEEIAADAVTSKLTETSGGATTAYVMGAVIAEIIKNGADHIGMPR